MSQKNKAPKLYVVEKKTASGKSWSKVEPAPRSRSFATAVDRLVALPDKVGEYRIRRLAVPGDKLRPALVLAVRDYSAQPADAADVDAARARVNALVNA